MHVRMHEYVHTNIFIHIYMYTHMYSSRQRERERQRARSSNRNMSEGFVSWVLPPCREADVIVYGAALGACARAGAWPQTHQLLQDRGAVDGTSPA